MAPQLLHAHPNRLHQQPYKGANSWKQQPTFERLAGDCEGGLFVHDVGRQRERLDGRAAAARLCGLQQPLDCLRRLPVDD